MKESAYTKAVDRYVEVKMKAIDRWVEEIVEPLEDIGNPEKLMGAPFEEWGNNPMILHLLGQIYGPEPNPLSNLIFRETQKRIQEKEATLKSGFLNGV